MPDTKWLPKKTLNNICRALGVIACLGLASYCTWRQIKAGFKFDGNAACYDYKADECMKNYPKNGTNDGCTWNGKECFPALDPGETGVPPRDRYLNYHLVYTFTTLAALLMLVVEAEVFGRRRMYFVLFLLYRPGKGAMYILLGTMVMGGFWVGWIVGGVVIAVGFIDLFGLWLCGVKPLPDDAVPVEPVYTQLNDEEQWGRAPPSDNTAAVTMAPPPVQSAPPTMAPPPAPGAAPSPASNTASPVNPFEQAPPGGTFQYK